MVFQMAEGNMQTIDWIYNNLAMEELFFWLGIKKTVIEAMKED